jgi:hypothetical protein
MKAQHIVERPIQRILPAHFLQGTARPDDASFLVTDDHMTFDKIAMRGGRRKWMRFPVGDRSIRVFHHEKKPCKRSLMAFGERRENGWSGITLSIQQDEFPLAHVILLLLQEFLEASVLLRRQVIEEDGARELIRLNAEEESQEGIDNCDSALDCEAYNPEPHGVCREKAWVDDCPGWLFPRIGA